MMDDIGEKQEANLEHIDNLRNAKSSQFYSSFNSKMLSGTQGK